MQNAREIIERVMELKSVKSVSALAACTGIQTNTLYSWLQRDSINLKLLLEKIGPVNLHWLLTGEEPPPGPAKLSDEEARYIAAGRLLEGALKILGYEKPQNGDSDPGGSSDAPPPYLPQLLIDKELSRLIVSP